MHRALFIVGTLIATTSALAQDLSMDRHRIEAGQLPAVAMRIADVDGDGLPDLVRLAGRSVSVLLQDGAGRFSPQDTDLNPPPGPVRFRDVAVGQLGSATALPDVAVLSDNGDVAILRNDGLGNLSEVLPSPVATPLALAARQILVADLDGTGGDDLVVVLDGGPLAMFLFLADGSGGFTDATLTHVTDNALLGTPDPHAALADCDGDGDLDLILVSSSTPPILLDNDLNGSEGLGVLSPNFGAFPATAPAASRVLAMDLLGDPLPDVVLGEAGPAQRSPTLYLNSGSGFADVPTASAFAAEGLLELLAADVDGDQIADLIALQEDGSVLLGKGSAVGSFDVATEALPAGARTTLAIGDLDNDGDLDIFTGGAQFEDQVLLGRDDGVFLDTEAVDFPIGPAPSGHLGALLDVDGNGDQDVVTYDQNGNPQWFRNDGSARFVPGNPLSLPDLPRDVGYHTLVAARVMDASRRELIAASNPGAAIPLLALVDIGDGYADQTDVRFPSLGLTDVVLLAAGPVCVQGVPGAPLDDLVLADSSGGLHLARNTAGVYSVVPGAFPLPPLADPSRILLGDIDNDGSCDVVVVENAGPMRVFMGSGTGVFSEPAAPRPATPARYGMIGDYDGDGNLDVTLVRPTTGLILLHGDGTGSFADRTPDMLWQQPRGHITDLKLLPMRTGGVALVVGAGNVPDQIFPWNGAELGPPVELPYRGSVQTTALLMGDLDREGDADVVNLRRRTLPGLRRNTDSHLSTKGATQIGRMLGLRFVAPQPDSGAFLFVGPSQPAIPTPYGLLRITPTILLETLFLAGVREIALDWPLPATLPPGMPSLQVAFVDQQLNITVSNLEFVVLTDH